MDNSLRILEARRQAQMEIMTLLRGNNGRNFNNMNFVPHFDSRNIEENNEFQKPLEDPTGMTEYFDTKVNSMISTVREYFPDLSYEFVKKCLESCRYSVEEVIDSIRKGKFKDRRINESFHNPMSTATLCEELPKRYASQFEKSTNKLKVKKKKKSKIFSEESNDTGDFFKSDNDKRMVEVIKQEELVNPELQVYEGCPKTDWK